FNENWRPLNTARPRTVNTARPVNTVRPRLVNTARPNLSVVNAFRTNQVNAVKASACWVWRPTKPNGASITLKRHNYVDGHPQRVHEDQGYVDIGCSRNMTGNMSYLSDFKEFNGGYVTFGGGANGGRITDSTTGGCQFVGSKLISWQCKKQTVVATSTTEAEYVAVASCCGQVLWIQNQMLDYGRHIKLEDSDGINTFPNTEIFKQLTLIGYVSNSDKLTFQKGHFSPQWRFLIHTILHCLSPKKATWEQFSSNIATAIICLATNRTFNFSKMIFEGMVKNLDRSTIPVESHHTPLGAPTTLQPPLSSPSRIPTRQETEVPQPSSPTHTHVADEAASIGVDVRHRGAATTVSTQGEAHSQPEDQLGVLSAAKILADVAKVHTYTRRRRIVNTGSGGISNASRLFSTSEELVSTAGASMPVSTAGMIQEANIVAVKDKGKGILTEYEPVQTKTKRKQEQERLVLESKELMLKHYKPNIQSLTGRFTLKILGSIRRSSELEITLRFSSTEATDDKERVLWVELKRLFDPDTEDELWELQRYTHDPLTWRLYDTYGVHHVSTEKGIYIFMLIEKEYPLSKRAYDCDVG
nr:putative ribonuclease H-like domain-containing protein [Tanacetum cinerariifolium]